MEKNVSGVDLDELMKARMELDQERGVETDPNMYSDYNKNNEETVSLENSDSEELSFGGGETSDAHNETVNETPEDLPGQKEERNEEISSTQNLGSSSENLSKFGAFSAFDVQENAGVAKKSELVSKPVEREEKSQEIPDEKVDERLEDVNSSDDLDKAINDILDEIDDEEDAVSNASKNEHAERGSQTGVDVETKPDELIETKTDANTQSQTKEDDGIITDFTQLKELLQKELKESENAIQQKQKEPEVVKFAEIEDFKFINEIAKDEFKNTDKFSYILGKRENGSTVFGNFKEHLNLAVFGKNDEIVNSFLNSLILCMCLKNSYADVNFALMDSNIDSTFDVYNKSSYLYFNRIAKTNKEIRDTLIEISKEVDDRYNKFAGVGVKSIEEYNANLARSSKPIMPYIIVVFNNYTSASQATDNDKINACLYQILKFGRIAGIYCVVCAKLPIENSQVNYNLSSRISFKGDTDSRFTIGEAGSDALKEDNDALYFNIATGEVEHVKTAKVTENELDLIIKDLED